MEITRNDWAAYIKKLASVNKKAASVMQKYLNDNGYDDTEEIIRHAYNITSKYGEAAASLACEMYERIAQLQGFLIEAAPAETLDFEYVASATTKILDERPGAMADSVGRFVKQAAADTMLQNAARDGAEFAWIPGGDSCAFCLTLASNGWQKASRSSLDGGHAEHIHANCTCEYAIRFDGKSEVAGYDPKEYKEIYDNAEGSTSREKIKSIRRELYADKKTPEI